MHKKDHISITINLARDLYAELYRLKGLGLIRNLNDAIDRALRRWFKERGTKDD